ncbi:hypothetical protein AURDEDRAFT_166941 [Auricularia subglabra TFB-10046 SS5]|nr:hypothetical protein AURDEDRAFT_166941 [Auricularia subglabra TFB-10046 SS5]
MRSFILSVLCAALAAASPLLDPHGKTNIGARAAEASPQYAKDSGGEGDWRIR